MHILITHSNHARTHALQLTRLNVLGYGTALLATLLMLTALMYHFVFLQAARYSWPVVDEIMKMVAQDELARRDRFLRENLDVMARQLGEMQAKLVQLEAVSERVSGLAGLRPEELRVPPAASASNEVKGGRGGPYIPTSPAMDKTGTPSLDHLTQWVGDLDLQWSQSTD